MPAKSARPRVTPRVSPFYRRELRMLEAHGGRTGGGLPISSQWRHGTGDNARGSLQRAYKSPAFSDTAGCHAENLRGDEARTRPDNRPGGARSALSAESAHLKPMTSRTHSPGRRPATARDRHRARVTAIARDTEGIPAVVTPVGRSPHGPSSARRMAGRHRSARWSARPRDPAATGANPRHRASTARLARHVRLLGGAGRALLAADRPRADRHRRRAGLRRSRHRLVQPPRHPNSSVASPPMSRDDADAGSACPSYAPGAARWASRRTMAGSSASRALYPGSTSPRASTATARRERHRGRTHRPDDLPRSDRVARRTVAPDRSPAMQAPAEPSDRYCIRRPSLTRRRAVCYTHRGSQGRTTRRSH